MKDLSEKTKNVFPIELIKKRISELHDLLNTKNHINDVSKYSSPVIFSPEQLIDNQWKKENKKVYTIEDLSEGRVAVINDGTKEELTTVLKMAFPKDISKVYGRIKYYAPFKYDKDGWSGYKNIDLPTQSVKEFIKQLKTENMDSRFPFVITSKQMQELFSSIRGNCSWKRELLYEYGEKVLAAKDILIDETICKRARRDANDFQNELLDEIFGKDEEFEVGDWVTVEKYISEDTLGIAHYKIGETFQISTIENSQDSKITKWIHSKNRGQISINSLRKATPEEIAKAQCPYKDGELCFVKQTYSGPWELRYATGKVSTLEKGSPLFYGNQKSTDGGSAPWKYHKSAKGVELPKD